jgi:trypsin
MSFKLLAIILTASLTSVAAPMQVKGLDFKPFIVGGTDAVKGEFPFQVSLQGLSGHFCGGSLIKTNWVLTAAHCVQGWKSSNKIIVGLHDRNDKTGTETFTAVKVLPHPQYDSKTMDWDYALLKLSGDSKFRTIELNNSEIMIPTPDSADQVNVWTSGWGTTSEGSFGLPRILQKVQVPLVSRDVCNAADSYNGDITERMICAGLQAGGKDSCQGDSGGPLFMQKTSGDYLLVGVVSWGEGCARANKFGVYSKVNAGIDWISQQTQ